MRTRTVILAGAAGLGVLGWLALQDEPDAPALEGDDVLTLSAAGHAAYLKLIPLNIVQWQPQEFADLLPVDVGELVVLAQQSSGLPACYIAAVVYAESRGNPQAVGDSGEAKGLIQSHPEWRDTLAQLVRTTPCRTVAGADLSRSSSLDAWRADPRAYPEIDLCALVEMQARVLDKIAHLADVSTWSARRLLLAMRAVHRAPTAAKAKIAAGLQPYVSQHAVDALDLMLTRMGLQGAAGEV